jgi:hypothetical protein
VVSLGIRSVTNRRRATTMRANTSTIPGGTGDAIVVRSTGTEI